MKRGYETIDDCLRMVGQELVLRRRTFASTAESIRSGTSLLSDNVGWLNSINRILSLRHDVNMFRMGSMTSATLIDGNVVNCQKMNCLMYFMPLHAYANCWQRQCRMCGIHHREFSMITSLFLIPYSSLLVLVYPIVTQHSCQMPNSFSLPLSSSF